MSLERFTPDLHHFAYEPTITTSEKTLLQVRKGVFSFALLHILPPYHTWDGIHILPVYKNAATVSNTVISIQKNREFAKQIK